MDARSGRRQLIAQAIAIVFITLVFHRIGSWLFSGWVMALGSHQMTTGSLGNFYALLAVFGLAFVYLGASMVRSVGTAVANISDSDRRSLARAFFPLVVLLAFVVPWNLRALVLHSAPVTDDEPTYLLASKILLDGSVIGQSPPFKLFFDRAFLVNDGRYFTQYFLGWPILMSPGTALGVPELMNPIYSALTVWPVFQILKRVTTIRWARWGIVLWVTSPFLLLNAATMMAHTSCTMCIAFGTYFAMRADEERTSPLFPAAMAIFFGLAFWNRPLTAIGLGAVPVLWWFVRFWRASHTGRERAMPLVGFLVASGAMAAVFLGINQGQSGHPFHVAYQEAMRYGAANDYRFSPWLQPPAHEVANMDLLPNHWETIGVSIYRLVFAGFGTPLALAVALVGARHRHGLLFAGMSLAFLVTSAFVPSAGVDVSGPVHDSELMLPAVVLVVLGFAKIESWELERGPQLISWSFAAAVSSVVACLVLYLPPRLATHEHIGVGLSFPYDVLRQEEIHDAVIFAPRPFIPPCATFPSRHWVYWRPPPSPSLDEDVIWVNHVSREVDARFKDALFPDREAYYLLWTVGCEATYVPMGELPESVPDALIGGSGDFSDVVRELDEHAPARPDGAS